MRPVRLTMQGIGPFADREVVDFREAVAAGLFGIYGPTGSGKSTIFSAMTFALFGEAAKAEQEISSLRSDHADPNMPTEVEFVFDIGLKRFVIRRRPEQMRPKERGKGETRDPHEAWFFDASGISIESITELNSGKVIVEKKIGAVNDAVIDCLGYGPDQFRQIVLLPQGKFETFLIAKTEKRLEILRELFDVSLYQRMSSKLHEDARATEVEIRQARELCARRLSIEGFESPDALMSGIADAGVKHEELLDNEKVAGGNHARAENQMIEARVLDQKFRNAEKANKDLEGLQAQTVKFDSLKTQVKNAKLAQSMADIENQLNQAIADVAGSLKKKVSADENSRSAESAAQNALKAFENEKLRHAQIGELRRVGDQLFIHRQTIGQAKRFENDAQTAKNELTQAKKLFDAAESQRNTISEKSEKAEAALRNARLTKDSRDVLNQQISVAETGVKAAEYFESASEAVAKASAKLEELKGLLTKSQSEQAAAEAKFLDAEAALAAAQALHLAAKLQVGIPCPVCGSTNHPVPATGAIEHLGLDQAFRTAKATLDAASTVAKEAANRHSAGQATWEERSTSLARVTKPEQNSIFYCEIIASLQSKIKALGPEINISQLEEGQRLLIEQLKSAEKALEDLRAAKEAATTKAALATQKVDQVLDSVPIELRKTESLELAISENIGLREALETALTKAEAADRNAREAALGAQKEAEAAKGTHSDSLIRHDKIAATFETRLLANGLTRPLYETYKANIGAIETTEIQIAVHTQKMTIALSAVQETALAIKDQNRPELEALESATGLAKQILNDAKNALATTAARLQTLKNLQNDVSGELKRLDNLERETATLRELSALFNAENPQRLSLETFAIGAMFDQVLTAANQRLQPMSGGRFKLEREIEEGKGRSRRGLGIRVHDIHTGRARNTLTLSGGESFIAALALALGLSDIVESSNGNIRLDTIFIDEGFGSLDTENEAGTLDQVLQTLTNLVSQNRSVGLISHVPLVQQTIPNGFYIQKTPTGSHVETRGIL